MIYGSGLRNGDANIGTVPPYTQFNVGIAREFLLPNDPKPMTVRFDVVNLFDTIYQIRSGTGIGVFAPQYGPRRGFFARRIEEILGASRNAGTKFNDRQFRCRRNEDWMKNMTRLTVGCLAVYSCREPSTNAERRQTIMNTQEVRLSGPTGKVMQMSAHLKERRNCCYHDKACGAHP